MATLPLTDAFVRNFGTGKARDEVFDARCPWSLDSRHHGKREVMVIPLPGS
jgi:hypothetical protein